MQYGFALFIKSKQTYIKEGIKEIYLWVLSGFTKFTILFAESQ
jgi:hypothetical protein